MTKKILAITACTAGVAHTYMAAKTLENKAKARGYEVKVEKQGANGIDDRITKQDVEEADGIIFATDVGIAEMERFDGLPFVKGKVKDGIKNADAMIDALEQKIATKGATKKTTKSAAPSTNAFAEEEQSGLIMGFFKQWYTGALSGVSHIIPLVIIGGLCVGLLNLFFGYDYTHLYNLTPEQLGDKEFMADFANTFQGIVHYVYYIALKAFNPLLICGSCRLYCLWHGR
ncbi:PTS fructose transporter subunit IIB [Psychromonas sp. KJ10-10]|uniref:PTS fructose transporter subunit IIB n=1 Tax=Psychromonas sp. KJ10-10 TaxID=3391823 RepID=UPI0039B4B4AC